MAIEFRCPTCSKLLRTKDDTAGKQAKCPECGTVIDIPAPGASSSAGGFNPEVPIPSPGFAPPPSTSAVNPYQSPTTHSPLTHLAPGDIPAEITPTRIDLGDVFSRTWTIFKANMGMCIGVVITANIINGIVSNIVSMSAAGISSQAGSDVARFAIIGIGQILSIVFSTWITAGQMNFLLKTARGLDAPFSDLFSGGRWLVPLLGGTILYFLMVVGGFILLIIPGIIVALMFSQFYYLIIDRNLGVIDALKTSRLITSGNKMTLFLIGLVMIPIAIIAALPCLIGLIFVIPYFALLGSVAYLMMSGQPTAVQRVAQGEVRI